jgi:hypothetical protein
MATTVTPNNSAYSTHENTDRSGSGGGSGSGSGGESSSDSSSSVSVSGSGSVSGDSRRSSRRGSRSSSIVNSGGYHNETGSNSISTNGSSGGNTHNEDEYNVQEASDGTISSAAEQFEEADMEFEGQEEKGNEINITEVEEDGDTKESQLMLRDLNGVVAGQDNSHSHQERSHSDFGGSCSDADHYLSNDSTEDDYHSTASDPPVADEEQSIEENKVEDRSV